MNFEVGKYYKANDSPTIYKCIGQNGTKYTFEFQRGSQTVRMPPIDISDAGDVLVQSLNNLEEITKSGVGGRRRKSRRNKTRRHKTRRHKTRRRKY